MEFLSEVEDVFNITGRGCVIVPGIPFAYSPPVKIGAELELRNPSGTIFRTQLKGVEMINRGKPWEYAPCLLDSNIQKHEIEIGAKLYLV